MRPARLIRPNRFHAMFIVLCMAYILVFVQHIGMTVIAGDVMDSLRLTTEEMGILGSAYLYGYALSQFCSGILAERFGPRRVLAFMFLLASVGGFVFVATSSFSLSFAARAVSGVGMAVVMTSSFTVFGRWLPAESYGRISAFFFATGGIGNYLGTAPLSWLNSACGWRFSYFVVACATLVVASSAWLIVRDWPGLSSGTSSDTNELSRQTITIRDLIRSLLRVAREKDFWKIAAWFVTMSSLFYAFAGLWAGMYFQDVYGLSKIEAGNLIAMGAFGFIIGNPLLNWACERVFKSHRTGIGLSGVLGTLAGCVLVFYTDGLSLPMLYVFVLVLGMACNAPNSLCYFVARSLFGARLISTIGGVFGFVTFISGGCLQVLIGFILHHAELEGFAPATAYSRAFIPVIACGVIAAIAGFTLTETYGKAIKE